MDQEEFLTCGPGKIGVLKNRIMHLAQRGHLDQRWLWAGLADPHSLAGRLVSPQDRCRRGVVIADVGGSWGLAVYSRLQMVSAAGSSEATFGLVLICSTDAPAQPLLLKPVWEILTL